MRGQRCKLSMLNAVSFRSPASPRGTCLLSELEQDESSLVKGGIPVHPTLRLYSPDGRTGLTVWLQFAIVSFG